MAQAETTRTTRRDLLRFAAAAIPAAIVGTAIPTAAHSDAELRSLISALSPQDRKFLRLRAKFEPLWEEILPIHEALAEWEGKPSAHEAWGEWNRLLSLLKPIADELLDPSVFTSTFTPDGFALKAAALLVSECASDQLGDELSWEAGHFMFEIVSAGRMAVPLVTFDQA